MLKKTTITIALTVPVLFLSPCNSALASAVYSIHLKKELHGTKIFAESSKINAPGSLTILKLSNLDSRDVECKATFNPRIEQKKSYKRRLNVNTTTSIRYTTSRAPNRLNIKLTCHPLNDNPPNRN